MDKTLKKWDPQSYKCIVTLAEHKDIVDSVDWSSNRNSVATDQTVILWWEDENFYISPKRKDVIDVKFIVSSVFHR